MSIHDFGMPLTYSDKPRFDKEAWMREHEKAKAAFYGAGKTHSVHAPTESLFNEVIKESGAWSTVPSRRFKMLSLFAYGEKEEHADQHVTRVAIDEGEADVYNVSPEKKGDEDGL